MSAMHRYAFASYLTLGLSCFTLACAGGNVDDEGGLSTFGTTIAAETTGDGDGDGDGDPGDGDGDGDGDPGDGDGDVGSCGDGVIDEGEQCDLGPENSAAGQCTPDCLIAACGDGYVLEGLEDCDDGNSDETDDCISTCTLAACGDGFVHEGVEACDDGNTDDSDDCNQRCMPGACGDGIVQAGEQCDDGDMDTTDDCPACQLAFCGDGYSQLGVEQCDDGNMENTDACQPILCIPSSCGDGFLWAGMEECDDGNLDDSDACPTSCVPAECGDGFVQDGLEECDDGNNIDNDGCTPNCISLSKRVFVSSMMYDGNLGGLMGADAKCQALADAANLAGTYMAWISTDQGSPSTRFTHSNTAYTLVDGTTQIAANWNALIDGNLDAPINKTETGGVPPVGNTSCAGGGFTTVWSATSTNGTLSGNSCTNFTSTQGGGLWGQAGQTNSSWTSWCSGGICTWTSPIYCFQQ
jgi:cysteine-rich repeat protein